MVRRIKGDLIDMLDFPNKLQIAISDTNIASVLSESETESKQKKSGETRPTFIAYLLSDGYPIKNLKYPIKNLKYPIKPKRGG